MCLGRSPPPRSFFSSRSSLGHFRQQLQRCQLSQKRVHCEDVILATLTKPPTLLILLTDSQGFCAYVRLIELACIDIALKSEFDLFFRFIASHGNTYALQVSAAARRVSVSRLFPPPPLPPPPLAPRTLGQYLRCTFPPLLLTHSRRLARPEKAGRKEGRKGPRGRRKRGQSDTR